MEKLAIKMGEVAKGISPDNLLIMNEIFQLTENLIKACAIRLSSRY